MNMSKVGHKPSCRPNMVFTERKLKQLQNNQEEITAAAQAWRGVDREEGECFLGLEMM